MPAADLLVMLSIDGLGATYVGEAPPIREALAGDLAR